MTFQLTPKRIALLGVVALVLLVALAVVALVVVKPVIASNALSAPQVLSQPTFPTAEKRLTIKTDAAGVAVNVANKYYYSNSDSVEIEIPNDQIKSIDVHKLEDKLIFRQRSTEVTKINTEFDFSAPVISNIEVISNADYKTNYQISFTSNEKIVAIAKNDKGVVVDACKAEQKTPNLHNCKFSLGESSVTLVAKDFVGNTTDILNAAKPEELAPISAKCDIPQNNTAAEVNIKCSGEKVQTVTLDKKSIEVTPEGFTLNLKLQNAFTTDKVLVLEDGGDKKYLQTISIPRSPVGVTAGNFANCSDNNFWVQVTGRINLPQYVAYGSNTSLDVSGNGGSIRAHLSIGNGPNQLSIPSGSYSASTLILKDKNGNRIPWGSNVKVTGRRSKSGTSTNCGDTLWESIFERI